jgi:hypothetical protein
MVWSDPDSLPQIRVFHGSVWYEILRARGYSQGDYVGARILSFRVHFVAPDTCCSLQKADIFWEVQNAGF